VVHPAFGDVAGERDDVTPDALRGLLKRCLVPVDGDDGPSRAGERFRDAGADALGRARDDDAAHTCTALRSKTSSISAHHSPGLASSTRCCIVRMSSSHFLYVGSSLERAKSFAGSKPSRVSQYMNMRRPRSESFIWVRPMSRRRATTSGHTSACSFLYR